MVKCDVSLTHANHGLASSLCRRHNLCEWLQCFDQHLESYENLGSRHNMQKREEWHMWKILFLGIHVQCKDMKYDIKLSEEQRNDLCTLASVHHIIASRNCYKENTIILRNRYIQESDFTKP